MLLPTKKYDKDDSSASSASEDEPKFKCFSCKETFTSIDYRYEHFRQVHCRKKYLLACSQCRRKFSTCDELLFHIHACHDLR